MAHQRWTGDGRLFPTPLMLPDRHGPTKVTATPAASPPPVRRALIGGVLGAVAGVATCTLISNAFFNEGNGTSTCTVKGNTVFAAGGFMLGFTIGWLTAPDRPGA